MKYIHQNQGFRSAFVLRPDHVTKGEGTMGSKNHGIRKRALWLLFLVFFILLPSSFAMRVLSGDCIAPWTQKTGTQYNMIATGKLYKNGVLINTTGYWVGSFGPGGLTDCRSVREVSVSGIHYETIVSDTNGETIRFKVHECSSGKTYDIIETLTFQSDDLKQNLDIHFNTTLPTVGLSKTSFNFGSERYGTPTAAETVIITNTGSGTLNWTATPSANWISASPGSGAGFGTVSIGISKTDMSPGYYTGTVTISDSSASNSPQTINVGLDILPVGTDSPPFGNYEVPLDNSTVASSLQVSGWVLDDVGTESVKIYRGSGLSDRVFIGDAVFSKGARPDVEAAYPGYPQNDRAGWGYMLLTNFLPNGGNGPFTLLAYAKDMAGQEVLLGSKAITCDNLHAVKPFGAIDTPSQGGTASGGAYVNFGWALTPQPNSIPINGSTITVWVNGLPLGHPTYNNYRSDIATLFPAYANSNGAVGYYYLNTNSYPNGMYTIAWLVADSGGNADGIGSRYFTVQNMAGGSGLKGSDAEGNAGNEMKANTESLISFQKTGIRSIEEIAGIPEDRRTPVYVSRGFQEDKPTETVFPETNGTLCIQTPGVSRLVVFLNEKEALGSEADREVFTRRILSGLADSNKASQYRAYELVRDELRPLPIGASFDVERGVLYWQPGPGFLGEYGFVIVDEITNTRRMIKIQILS